MSEFAEENLRVDQNEARIVSSHKKLEDSRKKMLEIRNATPDQTRDYA